MDVFLIVLQFLLQLGDGLRVSLGLAQLLDGRLQASEVLSGELGTDRRLTTVELKRILLLVQHRYKL